MTAEVDLLHVPVIIVDKVTKTGCVDDGKTETDTILLDIWRNKVSESQLHINEGSLPALML